MKKKRKRSASSLSSSSASSRNSSAPSSSSSSRRRSRKKKKKRRRSERGSKRHRRISSRGSRGSEEGKSEKNGGKDEDEVEWYPAPPNTSATFLNKKGGPGFGEGDDEEEVEEKIGEERRISQLYSLSAASDNEESDSSRRETKRRESKENRTGRRKSRSPERKDRQSRSSERRDKYREREKEDKGRNSDSKRRSSLDENRKRKVSCSSVDSEYSRKSSFSGSASKLLENRPKRNSVDGSSFDNRGREDMCEVEEVKREKEPRQGGAEGGLGKRSESAGNHKEQRGVSGESSKKALPSNLLDIFSQIAKFEKDKGVGPKK